MSNGLSWSFLRHWSTNFGWNRNFLKFYRFGLFDWIGDLLHRKNLSWWVACDVYILYFLVGKSSLVKSSLVKSSPDRTKDLNLVRLFVTTIVNQFWSTINSATLYDISPYESQPEALTKMMIFVSDTKNQTRLSDFRNHLSFCSNQNSWF